MRPVKSFAIAASWVKGLPWSASQAACRTSPSAAATSVAQSARYIWMACLLPIGPPNWTRSLANLMPNSSARFASPTAAAEMPSRP